MTAQEKRLKALGAALRAKLKDCGELPQEVESLLQRLVEEHEDQRRSRRVRA
jgi:hypothetical protein